MASIVDNPGWHGYSTYGLEIIDTLIKLMDDGIGFWQRRIQDQEEAKDRLQQLRRRLKA